MHTIDPAATAWLLASTALVLLMTPGLAIFYGGMVRTTGVLNMIMMSFISIPLVTVAWLLVGYSIAFSDDAAGGVIGDLQHIGMLGIGPGTLHGTVPELLYATFQLGFAIVTAALVSGAIADRAKFAAWIVFVPVWAIVVYCVVAHWVWGPGGWLAKLGVLDYAGGLVVEIVSGSSALALALVLGPRIGFKKDAMRPHNLPFVLLGVGLLWFGWFGFNAGSALAANGTAAAIFLNTLVAGCLGMLGWLSVEQLRDGRPTTFGAASGVVAGLVAITPSCGTVNTLGSAVVGVGRRYGLLVRGGREIPLQLRRFARCGRRAFRRRCGRRAVDRTSRHGRHDVGPAGPLLRGWPRPAGKAGAGGCRRRALRVHGVVRARQAARPADGLPGQRPRRNHRCRLHSARRNRLCRRRARTSLDAAPGLRRPLSLIGRQLVGSLSTRPWASSFSQGRSAPVARCPIRPPLDKSVRSGELFIP